MTNAIKATPSLLLPFQVHILYNTNIHTYLCTYIYALKYVHVHMYICILCIVCTYVYVYILPLLLVYRIHFLRFQACTQEDLHLIPSVNRQRTRTRLLKRREDLCV